jgi:ligand-binding SRPBCC domain-containing protein
VNVFEYTSAFPFSPQRLWAFHERPDVIKLLTPPLTPLHIVRQSGGLEVGAEKEFRIGVWPLQVRWLARHVEYEHERLFADLQVEGPFRYWLHIHVIAPEAKGGSRLTDRVTYEFPGGPVVDRFIRWQLNRMFHHRHAVTGRLA